MHHNDANTLNETKEKRNTSKEQLLEIKSNAETCDGMLRENAKALHDVTSSMNAIESEKKDRLTIFGASIPKLLQAIEQHRHEFHQVPVGPIGSYVNVPQRHQKFVTAIDMVLGSSLSSFIVTDEHDRSVLERLKRKINSRDVPVIMSKVSDQKYTLQLPLDPSVASHTIALMIEVDHPVVFNVLIDVTSMENKVIYETRKEAEEAIFICRDDGSVQMPQNVKEAYEVHGDRMYARIFKTRNRFKLVSWPNGTLNRRWQRSLRRRMS
jgi:chromosome segregation ATPase